MARCDFMLSKILWWLVDHTIVPVLTIVLGDDDWETSCKKKHISLCQNGYIRTGGLLLYYVSACWHCNNMVYNLSDLLRDKKLGIDLRIIIKDELERAKQDRADGKLSYPKPKETSVLETNE